LPIAPVSVSNTSTDSTRISAARIIVPRMVSKEHVVPVMHAAVGQRGRLVDDDVGSMRLTTPGTSPALDGS
jgi:hypothetical protein